MKKTLFYLCLSFACCNLSARQLYSGVALLSGGGDAVGEVSGGKASARQVERSSGQLLLANPLLDADDDSGDPMSPTLRKGGHRGLDFSIDMGYHFGTNGGGGMASVGLGLGKRFSRSFYWGLGSGAFFSTGVGDPMIPITPTWS